MADGISMTLAESPSVVLPTSARSYQSTLHSFVSTVVVEYKFSSSPQKKHAQSICGVQLDEDGRKPKNKGGKHAITSTFYAR